MKTLVQFSFVAILALPRIMAADETANVQPAHSCSDIERFLMAAHPGALRTVSAGVTGTRKMTLEEGNFQHDAHLQTIDERKTTFQAQNGNTEMNFRDSYKYNIASYELAKMLELNMVPPYVERKIGGDRGSLSWWIDNAMMESDRYKKNIAIPDSEAWNRQMYAIRVFHELIYDTDPNLTNILITKDWQLWIIDSTRAFRLHPNIREPKNLVQIDRRLLDRLRHLDEKTLKAKLSAWLTNSEIHALDARRAKIVRFFDDAVKAKGETAVLYDFPRTNQPCGLGL